MRIRFSVLTGKKGFHDIGRDLEALEEALGLDRLEFALVLDAGQRLGRRLLLVDLKMPPSRIGTYSNFTPMRCSIAGIARWLR